MSNDQPVPYPKLETPLPPHLHARLHAAAAVLRVPLQELVERALEGELARLDPKRREVVDRVAASLIVRSEWSSSSD